MKNIFISSLFIFLTNGFYTFNVITTDGQTIPLSQFEGKKILLVNTASGSEFVDQYAKLEQLYQQFKDSLVIIAFPSNSFGYEPGDNNTIKGFVQSTYQIHFLICQKTNVTGSNISPLFHWLVTGTENGTMNRSVKTDFQKFLIDPHGNLIGVFAGAVDPLSDDIKDMIQQSSSN